MQPLTVKYRPKNLSEVIGQDKAIKELKKFIINFKKLKKKATIIYGPSGIGKTCSIYALAKELGLEIFETNASEFRNAEQINTKLGSAIQQHSLFSKGKIILIDEIDALSGKEDRGGVPAILKLIDKTTFPIIITATNPWSNKLSSLRNKTNLIQFEQINNNAIFGLLKEICSKEKIKCDEAILKILSRRAGGDLRAAINDLENISITAQIEKDSLDDISIREKTDTIINALTKIFKTTDPKLAITSFENVEEDLNQQILWLDENLPKEYTNPEDLARAYDKLSKADVFNRRIKRWQHWRFLVYINALITAGIAVSKDKKYKNFVQYKPTGRLLKLWWAKQKSMKKKAIAQKIAKHTHSSTKDIIKNIEFFKLIYKKNKDMANKITRELDLNKEEVLWLKK